MLKCEKNKDIFFLSKKIGFCFCSLKFHVVGAVYQSADFFSLECSYKPFIHPGGGVDFLIWTSSHMDSRLWSKHRVWHSVESHRCVSLSDQGWPADPTFSEACPAGLELRLRHKWPRAAGHKVLDSYFHGQILIGTFKCLLGHVV